MADIYIGGHLPKNVQRHVVFPYLLLIGFLGVAAIVQSMPMVLPIGPMYWDVLVYYDAIGRINAGQLPVTDFMVPVGPLEYWLAWFSDTLFPYSQPVLLTQLFWLPITAPVMAAIIWDASKRSKMAVWGLLIPWIFFTALPFNLVTYNNFAGTDAYGIYNRHGSHLMYLVAATVLYVRSQVLQTILLSVLLLSLAFCKITAFAAVGPLLVLALMTRRVQVRTAFTTALICIGVTGFLEIFTGVVSAYITSILQLASGNTDTLLPRFLTAISLRFDILAAGAVLCVLLFYAEVLAKRRPRDRDRKGIAGWFDRDWIWIGLSLACGLLFETQNTGSHPYLLVWPAVLRLLLRPTMAFGKLRFAIYVVIAFVIIPPVSNIAHKAARAAALAPRYEHLDAPRLGPLGRVSAKDVYVEQAQRMRGIYIQHRTTMAEIAKTEALPSFRIFSEHDYQFLLLQEMDLAADAIMKIEARSGEIFNDVFDLDFANPFTYILKKPGPRLVTIGADPSRSIPVPDAATLAAIAATDLILAPKCPYHHARAELQAIYSSALQGRHTIKLTDCYDALLKPGSPVLKSIYRN